MQFRDISELVRLQKEYTDSLYLDAIEANYSHEMFTPLNSIMTNCQIVLKKLQELSVKNEGASNRNYANMMKFSKIHVSLTNQILRSSEIMYFYNKNIIINMHLRRGSVDINKSYTNKVQMIIDEVIRPFDFQIENRQIKVFFQIGDNLDNFIEADWNLYQLLMFNIVQNAVKYNKFGGMITLKLDIVQVGFGRKWFLQTEVFDTGSGIDKKRLSFLFKAFGELRRFNSLKEVKDNGIGIGLTCSKSIVDFMGGDIQIKSQPELTNVTVSIPVNIVDKAQAK